MEFRYFSADEARAEITLRQADNRVYARVMESLGNLPHGFPERPFVAAATSFIATPNLWNLGIAEQAAHLGLPIVFCDYTSDKFTTYNRDKVGLLKLRTIPTSKGERKIFRVANPTQWDGKVIRDIKTQSGENLVDFHHKLLGQYLPAASIVDLSRFYKEKGPRAERYYPSLLSLFVWHGILFEDYHTYIEGLFPFVRRVIMPAYALVTAQFGMSPIIVRHPWKKGLDCYPQDLVIEQ